MVEDLTAYVTLASQSATLLSLAAPYLQGAAEGASKKIGEDIWNQAKKLLAKLRDRFKTDDNATADQTLTLFLDNPQTFDSALITLLVHSLQQHPEWADEVRDLLSHDPVQEIIARNNSRIENIEQSNIGSSGKQSIVADNSEISGVRQDIR